jgi:hypothetical protein
MDAEYDEWPDEQLMCGHEYVETHGAEPPPRIARLAFLTADDMQAELAHPNPEQPR